MPITSYHDSPGLSFHALKDFALSPRYYHDKHIAGIVPRRTCSAYRIGSLVHMAILEPERFSVEVVEVPQTYLTGQGKISTAKEARSWIDSLEGQEYVTPEEREQIARMAESVHDDDRRAELLRNGSAEVEWHGTHREQPVKGCADLISDGRVFDLKTISSLKEAVSHIKSYHYLHQLAWYADRFEVEVGEIWFVEKNYPHQTLEVSFTDDAIEIARAEVNCWFENYVLCAEVSDWPINGMLGESHIMLDRRDLF